MAFTRYQVLDLYRGLDALLQRVDERDRLYLLLAH